MDSNIMAEAIKPDHQRILDNKEKFNMNEIIEANAKANIERDEAKAQGTTVDDLRLKKYLERKAVFELQRSKEDEYEARKNADLKTFGSSCLSHINGIIHANGGAFDFTDEKVQFLYRELIRYFHWDSECEKLDKSRHLYLFGVYGCGKSLAVKAIQRTMMSYGHNNWQYFHLPTLTKNYMANVTQGYKSNNAFEELFDCGKNMIIDEIGDKSEKQKFYGNEIESVRSLILDKYDKWVTSVNKVKGQKIVFTSNLFPDKEYFFNKSDNDTRPTVRNFYDDKVYNKIGEMCNLVRFPNVSYRANNKIELL